MKPAYGTGPAGPRLQLWMASALTIPATPLAAQRELGLEQSGPRCARRTWHGRKVSATPVLSRIPLGPAALPVLMEPGDSRRTAHSFW